MWPLGTKVLTSTLEEYVTKRTYRSIGAIIRSVFAKSASMGRNLVTIANNVISLFYLQS